MWILELITEATGVTDTTERNEIYDLMCDQVHSFSNATGATLRKEARAAKALNDYLKTDAGKAEWDTLAEQMMGRAA